MNQLDNRTASPALVAVLEAQVDEEREELAALEARYASAIQRLARAVLERDEERAKVQKLRRVVALLNGAG